VIGSDNEEKWRNSIIICTHRGLARQHHQPDGPDRARPRVGLDGVVITDHDYQWEAGELADLAARADGLKVFTGAEVSTREGATSWSMVCPISTSSRAGLRWRSC